MQTIKTTKILIILMFFCLATGAAVGALCSHALKETEYDRLSENITVYLNTAKNAEDNRMGAFAECVLKYGKTLVLIWFLAFLPPAAIASFFLIFVKGMGLGFTTALLIRALGADGAVYAARLCLLQNLLLIPAYIYAAFSSLTFSLDFLRQKTRNKPGIPEYILTLAICLCIVMLASVAEVCLVSVDAIPVI